MTQAQDRPRRRRRPRRPAAEPAGDRAAATAEPGTPAGPAATSAEPATPPGSHPAAATQPAPSARHQGQPDAGRRDQPGPRDGAGRRGETGRRSGAARPDDAGRNEAGRGSGRDAERGWRELTGNAPSQVGLGGALRARDVARPTPEDLAEAERTVVVVRRQWQPPEG